MARPSALTVTDLHDAHADFVFRSLQRLGVREADLEDMLQEVFVVVHRQLPGFDGRSRVTTWLFGIALRVASAYRNRAWVRREVPVLEDDLPEGTDGSPDPERSLAERQARTRLEVILDGMELDRRAVFVMFEIDELPCEEIAQIMGTPVGTVYSRLSAARKDFKAALDRHAARDERRRVTR